MTTVLIESGICGFSTTIRVFKGEKRKVGLAIQSTCEKVDALGREVQEMDMLDVIKNPINENPVYMKAGECRLHGSCPVPCGVLKAAEVALGLALPKDVKIGFMCEE
jgi:hypothetical protein